MNDQRAPGYYLVRIFSPELLLSFEEPEGGAASEQNAAVGWDWFAHSTTIFDVILRVEISPTTERQERVKATVVGRFERVGEPERPAFKSFVMQNASAMLAPYLREGVTALTTRGLFGSVLLPPMNVIEVMARMDFERSLGFAHVREHLELATAYGIAYLKLPESSESAALNPTVPPLGASLHEVRAPTSIGPTTTKQC